jgi:hypothetical protein
LNISYVIESTELTFTNNIAIDIRNSDFDGTVTWSQEENNCDYIRVNATSFVNNTGTISCKYVQFSVVDFAGGANFLNVDNLTMDTVEHSTGSIFTDNLNIEIADSTFDGHTN